MLSQPQKEILKTELEGSDYVQFGQDYPAIAQYLNHVPSISNPVQQGQIQRTYSLGEMFTLLSQTELTSVLGINTSFRVWAHSLLPSSTFTAIPELLALLASLIPNATGEKPFLEAISNLVSIQSKSTLVALDAVLLNSGVIGQATHDHVLDYLNQSIPDPNWKALIPGKSRAEDLGLPKISELDIQAVLNPT